MDLHSLTLQEKKGYLTISLVHNRDGKILLRSWQGIHDWYDCLKGAMAGGGSSSVADTGTGLPDSSSTDQWLLSRRNITGRDMIAGV